MYVCAHDASKILRKKISRINKTTRVQSRQYTVTLNITKGYCLYSKNVVITAVNTVTTLIQQLIFGIVSAVDA